MQKFRIHGSAVLILVATLVACGDQSEPAVEPPADLVFQGVPVIPLSTAIAQSGSANAAQTDLYAPYPPDSAANWYRRRLIDLDWEIESDTRSPDGTITLYATRQGPPLWVIMRPSDRTSNPGTSYSMIGALIDTVRVNELAENNAAPPQDP